MSTIKLKAVIITSECQLSTSKEAVLNKILKFATTSSESHQAAFLIGAMMFI